MVGIRAHFDGKVIVPDEPVNLPPNAEVVVLIDSEDSPSAEALDRAIREYYQSQTPEDRAEDDAWAEGLAGHFRAAFDDE